MMEEGGGLEGGALTPPTPSFLSHTAASDWMFTCWCSRVRGGSVGGCCTYRRGREDGT